MHLTRYLINRSQILIVEAQAPGTTFSRIRRAESDALQMVFKCATFPLACWRSLLALFLFPKILVGWALVCFGMRPIPPPALDLANAKNNSKVGKKIGFNTSKKGH